MWNGPGGGNWMNWPNPSQQMQDLRHDQIDWASLAKQWIQKKDHEVPVTSAAPPVTTVGYNVLSVPPPPPPPPPEISAPPAPSIAAPIIHHTSPPLPPGLEVEDKEADVQGEMDMEIEEEHNHPNGGEFTETSWQWNNPVPPTINHPPHSQNWNYHTNSWAPGGGRPNATTWSVEGGSSFPPSNQEEDYIPQYGTEPDFSMGGRSAAQMILDAEKEADFQLDAAQRRKLPLWIREGLEKMEREKLKQMEREKAASEKEALMKKRRDAGDWKNDDPSRSKFDSDSDTEEPSNNFVVSANTDKLPAAPAFQRRKSRFDALAEAAKPRLASVPEEGDSEEERSEKEEAEEMPPVSREEKLKEKTVLLKRWMTEVLLEVTSELLETVCSEVVERELSKAPAVEVHKNASSGLTTLTGGVLGGLSMYSDSDDSDGDGKSRGSSPQPNEANSDEELQDIISAKKKRFETVEKSIMDRLQKQAMKELGETSTNGDGKRPKEQDASERKDPKIDADIMDGIRDESSQSTELSQGSSKKAGEISDNDSTSSVESKKSKKKKSKKEKHKKSKDKKKDKKKRRRSFSDGSLSDEDDILEKNSSRSSSVAQSDISKRRSIDRRSNDRSSKHRYLSRDKTSRYSRDRRTERESSSRYSRHSRADRSRSRRKDRSRSRRKDRSRSRIRDRSRSSRRDRSRSRSGRSRRHRSRSESKRSKRDRRSRSRSKRSKRHRSRSVSKKSSRRDHRRSYSPSVSSRSASRSISPYSSSKYKKSSRRRSRS